MSWEEFEPGLRDAGNWSSAGFNKHIGLRLLRWGPGAAEGALDYQEFHRNSLGVTHGGVSMTALDFAMGMSGCFAEDVAERRMCMTMSMTTNFIAPVRDGRFVIRAWVTGGGRSTFFPKGEIRSEAGDVLATASGVFRYLKSRPNSA